MRVVSVNIGEKKAIEWNGQEVFTGIYKYPVNQPIILGKEDVVGDQVIDRRYHGGIDKACYIYSADHYPFWQEKYPALDWTHGMFGENITVEGLNEAQIQIGDIYSIGECRVQVTQPRQPCFKLGVRFNNQLVLKDFINAPFPGIYVKVIEEGKVAAGDSFTLSERLHNSIGLLEVWNLLYQKDRNPDLLDFAIDFHHLADACRESLRKRRG